MEGEGGSDGLYKSYWTPPGLGPRRGGAGNASLPAPPPARPLGERYMEHKKIRRRKLDDHEDYEEMTEAEKRAEDLDATFDLKSEIDFCRGPLEAVVSAANMAELFYEKTDPEVARRIREDPMGLTLGEVVRIFRYVPVTLEIAKALSVLEGLAGLHGLGGEGA